MITWEIQPDLSGAVGELAIEGVTLFRLRASPTFLRSNSPYFHYVGSVKTATLQGVAETPLLPTLEAAQRAAEALLIDVLIGALEAATASVAGTMTYANATVLWRRLDTAGAAFEARVLRAAPDYPEEEE
jgi:hypothetical protein